MKVVIFLKLLFISIFISSCSSIDSDAKKAAELEKESVECIREGDLEKAEKIYSEIKKIIDKYEQDGRAKEFYKAYETYLKQPGS